MDRKSRHPWDASRARVQEELRRVRASAGLTQAELGQLMGRHQAFVSRYERGERRLDLVDLALVCRACKTDLTAFVSRLDPLVGGSRALAGRRLRRRNQERK